LASAILIESCQMGEVVIATGGASFSAPPTEPGTRPRHPRQAGECIGHNRGAGHRFRLLATRVAGRAEVLVSIVV
jgi:hypothetical protein